MPSVLRPPGDRDTGAFHSEDWDSEDRTSGDLDRNLLNLWIPGHITSQSSAFQNRVSCHAARPPSLKPGRNIVIRPDPHPSVPKARGIGEPSTADEGVDAEAAIAAGLSP
jgi:hypothetical protein